MYPGSNAADDTNQLLRALARWDNEGGSLAGIHAETSSLDEQHGVVPELTNAELVALRVRIIALENLMISLLATASDRQLELAREMAGYISPRPGFTHHPLTLHAAAHMNDLVERSSRFRRSQRA
jgi:hypothetical protein